MDLRGKLSGKFLVLDGPDGSGKSTQLRLLADRLRADGVDAVLCKDPGGTVIGDRIRSLLLDHDLSGMDVRCETFLFMASRAQLVGEIVEPALKAGRTVLCDRFISATCAYQGAAGYDMGRILELGRFAVGETWPHLTLIVDVPAEAGLQRIARKRDAMEVRPVEYHRRVRGLFLSLPSAYPGVRAVIDGARPPEQVHADIVETLKRVNF